jgi:hypothetical protein
VRIGKGATRALGRPTTIPAYQGAILVRKPEAELGSALDRLVQAGLLSRQGVPPQASYLFKNALVQDAAYGTLLREPRRRRSASSGCCASICCSNDHERDRRFVDSPVEQAGFEPSVPPLENPRSDAQRGFLRRP